MSTAVATEFPHGCTSTATWCDAKGGGTLAVINPADESVLAEVAYGGREDAERAIEAAARAFPEWRAVSVYDRAKILEKDRRADARPRRPDRPGPDPGARQAARGSQDGGAARGRYVRVVCRGRESGPTVESFLRRISPSVITSSSIPSAWLARITPWNFPAALPSRKIAPALAAGCTVVSRPADQTPLTLILMFECLADAGLPPGVANLVIGRSAGRRRRVLRTAPPCARSASRIDGRRQGADPTLGRSGQATEPRAGWPRSLDRFSRRRRAAGRPGRGHRQVPQQRAGLHRPVAILRPREDRRRLHRGGRRADPELENGQRTGAGRAGRPDVRGPARSTKTAGSVEDARGKGAKILTGGGQVEPLRQGVSGSSRRSSATSTAR